MPVSRKRKQTPKNADSQVTNDEKKEHNSKLPKKLEETHSKLQNENFDLHYLKTAVQNSECEKVLDILKLLTITKEIESNYLDSCLYLAVLNCNSFICQTLIYHGANFTFKEASNSNKNCVHIAAEKGFIDILAYILKRLEGHYTPDEINYILETVDEHGNTPLILCQSSPAASYITEALLNLGASVKTKNKSGESALMRAVQNRNIWVIEELFKRGADVDIKDGLGRSPVSIAAALDMDGLFDVLNFNCLDSTLTLVMKAALSGNLHVLRSLVISSSIKINQFHQSGKTALSMFLEQLTKAIAKKNKENRKSLKTKSDPEKATSKDIEIISVLVKAGSDILSKGQRVKNMCPLILASQAEDKDILRPLLKYSKPSKYQAHVNGDIFSEAGIIASERGDSDFLEMLIPFILSGKTDKVKNNIEKCVYLSIKKGFDNCVKQLFEIHKDFDVESIVGHAALSGNLDVFRTVQSRCTMEKFNELVVNSEGTEWLCKACSGDCIAIVEILLAAGAKTNFEKGIEKQQPLMCVKSGPVCQLLIDHGADIHRKVSYSHWTIFDIESFLGHKSAAYFACQKGLCEVLKVLLNNGISICQDIYDCLFQRGLKGDVAELILDHVYQLKRFSQPKDPIVSLAISNFENVHLIEKLVKKGADVNELPKYIH